jgi:hypothetical protein
MKRLTMCALVVFCSFGTTVFAQDPSTGGACATHPCMTTFHNSNTRIGLNPRETVLVTNSSGAFPTLTYSTISNLDGMIYGQPLYVYGVAWTGSTTCPNPTNMVYVATEANTLYAINADSPYTICKYISLNQTGTNADTAIPVTSLPGTPACDNISGSSTYGSVGVTGTPVIDPANQMLFVVSAHQSVSTNPTTWTQRLNAVNIASLTLVTSLDLYNAINNSRPSGYPTFYAQNEVQRSGLLITRGTNAVNIYAGWASFCDKNISGGGSFGLVSEFDFNYTNLTFGSQAESFYAEGSNTNMNYTPTAPAGVWMSGGAPAADAAGNVYFAVGNGNFQGFTTPLNFGESIVKLDRSTFGVDDYYTPNVWPYLNGGTKLGQTVSCGPSCQVAIPNGDWDLGSGGVVLITPSSGSAYGELVAGGKEEMFYVTFYCASSTLCPSATNWNQLMGGLDGIGYGHDLGGSDPTAIACTPATMPSTGSIRQCFYGNTVTTEPKSGQRATPAYWPNATPYLYTVGTEDVLKAYPFSTSTGIFTVPAPAVGGTTYGYPGATPVISSNGSDFSSAVVWALSTAGSKSGLSAALTAYAANPGSGSTLATLWTSPLGSGPGSTKYMVPTVANGKVYVAGQNVGGCGSSGCGGMLVIYHP